MDLAHIRAHIGAEKYAAVCAAARIAAPTTGMKSDIEPVIDVPMDIGDLIWAANLTDTEKVDLLFQVYAEMPSSSLFLSLVLEYSALSAEARSLFWRHIRALLSQPDPMYAQPLAYVLWCDFFEDARRVGEAWNAVITTEAAPQLVERVLDVSGPVPFAWKQHLYAQLIADPRWHPAIFRSLLFSQFDVYGKIDQAAAQRILQLLELPPDTPDLALLRTRLETPDRQ